MNQRITQGKRPTWRLLAAGLAVGLVAWGAASPLVAGEDQGQVDRTPWSGYWWPHREGQILGPLAKYDQLTGKAAAAWERKQHPPGPEVPRWHGYCHAWAASAVREPEPAQSRVAQGRGRQLPLGVGDQKGLLSLTHAYDEADSYGDRFGDGRGSEDRGDLAPDQLWQLLKLYIKQQRLPLVLDIEAGEEVWNFPVYAYKITYAPHGGNNQQLAQLTLWFADDFVTPDYVGVKVRRQTYWFTFELRGNKIVAGSGKWHGPSVKDHPDFAWFPTVQRAENPEIDYAQVRQFVGRPVAGTSPPPPTPTPAPPTPPAPPPTPAPPTPTPPTPMPPTPMLPANPDNPPPPTPAPPVPGTVPSTPNTPPRPAPTPAEQPVVLSAWELLGLVANKTSAFPLDITVDRFDGGEYQIGEALEVRGSSSKAGYLYLLYLNGQGELALLYPQPGQTNRVEASTKFTIPGGKDEFAIRVEGPAGVARIKAVVTSRPLHLSGLASNATQQQQATPKPQQQQLQRQEFRWPPSQAQQIQQLVAQYQREERLSQEEFGRLDPKTYLGEFAQDEVAFYVGAAAPAKPKQSPDAKQTPSQTKEKPPKPQPSDKPGTEQTEQTEQKPASERREGAAG
ncbi:MAG: DUF4384 domain-containing protein [Pirellulales bacterium]